METGHYPKTSSRLMTSKSFPIVQNVHQKTVLKCFFMKMRLLLEASAFASMVAMKSAQKSHANGTDFEENQSEIVCLVCAHPYLKVKISKVLESKNEVHSLVIMFYKQHCKKEISLSFSKFHSRCLTYKSYRLILSN